MERNNFASPVEAVRVLVSYGLVTGLLEPEDAVYAANQLFDILKIEPDSGFTITAEEIADAENARQRLEADPDAADRATQAADGSAEDLGSQLEIILRYLLDDAAARGVTGDGVTERDLFDTRLMGVLTPRPAEVVHTFRNLYQKNGAEAATSYFYRLSRNSDYIRTYRVRKDRRWVTATRYGDIDISINLSKPETDPKAIAAALHKKQDSYPRCLLCPENIGYAGRLDHPARQTIRLIPLTLGGQQWYMQYSPYVYYPEHCIVLSGEHVPMRIDRGTFTRLLEFETKFPHYTIGSNADLPIVGGSILTHEHFQGGRYTFAMARAKIRTQVSFPAYPDIDAGIVDWPMSVLRLDSADPDRLVDLADKILTAWRGYSDPAADILSETDGTPHNTITPIARMREGRFELDLVLRNNRTTEQYPLGIFHPHQDKHHIKKENIGLIEVMGLAVLPARLLGEMDLLKKTILAGKDVSCIGSIRPHAAWAEQILTKHPSFRPEEIRRDGASFDEDGVPQNDMAQARKAELDRIIEEEIGLVFAGVLEDAGVYKDTPAGREAFMRFIRSLQET